MKGLLPLLAYPVIFFVLALFPLINRLYGAISPHDSFGLMMAHAITEALWGSCSALVLIGHIAYVVYKRNHETSATLYHELSQLDHKSTPLDHELSQLDHESTSLDHESTPSDHESLVATTNSGTSNYGAVHNEEM